MRYLIALLPLLALACEQDCPTCQQDDPCKFTTDQIDASWGLSRPIALDLNKDGKILGDDLELLVQRCGSDE